ncbi:MAG TPA: hypothetical protein VLZ28_08680 [Daejeonella sp.]|nr:hypothetical protein [Daejeonella sp.]
MATLIIEGDDTSKLKLLATLAKELGLTVQERLISDSILNADTLAALEELNAGKGKKFASVQALFDSIE